MGASSPAAERRCAPAPPRPLRQPLEAWEKSIRRSTAISRFHLGDDAAPHLRESCDDCRRTGAEVKAARRHPSKIQRRLPPSDSPPLSSSAPRRVAPPHPTPPTGSSQPRPSSRRPASSSLTPPCRPPWLPVRPSHRCLTREVHKSRAKRRPRR